MFLKCTHLRNKIHTGETPEIITEKLHKAAQGSIMDKWALSVGQHRKHYQDASLENWQFGCVFH